MQDSDPKQDSLDCLYYLIQLYTLKMIILEKVNKPSSRLFHSRDLWITFISMQVFSGNNIS